MPILPENRCIARLHIGEGILASGRSLVLLAVGNSSRQQARDNQMSNVCHLCRYTLLEIEGMFGRNCTGNWSPAIIFISEQECRRSSHLVENPFFWYYKDGIHSTPRTPRTPSACSVPAKYAASNRGSARCTNSVSQAPAGRPRLCPWGLLICGTIADGWVAAMTRRYSGEEASPKDRVGVDAPGKAEERT